MRAVSAFLIGVLFGLGLVISGMVNPAKIIGFLDITGDWDPSLALVMVSALVVSFVGYRVAFARQRPFLEDKFQLPAATQIDRTLIVGAGIFGVGWGLAGLCPGPGLTALTFGDLEPFAFVAAMLAGMAAKNLVRVPG